MTKVRNECKHHGGHDWSKCYLNRNGSAYNKDWADKWWRENGNQKNGDGRRQFGSYNNNNNNDNNHRYSGGGRNHSESHYHHKNHHHPKIMGGPGESGSYLTSHSQAGTSHVPAPSFVPPPPYVSSGSSYYSNQGSSGHGHHSQY